MVYERQPRNSNTYATFDYDAAVGCLHALARIDRLRIASHGAFIAGMMFSSMQRNATMRYEPYEDEYAAVPTMTDEELLEYFLFRVLETDEVWGLKDGPQWTTREVEGQETLPVWPFKRFASEAAVGEWQKLAPVASSVDGFIFQTLSKSARQGVMIEIMPRKSGVGCLINPQRLVTILEETMHSAEYTLED